MSIPVTREVVSPETEDTIRERVRNVIEIDRGGDVSRLVTLDDVEALYDFFAIPEVSDPLYTIEKPVTRENVAAKIQLKLEAHARGEGILTALFDDEGRIVSFMDHTIWPQWSAAEFGGGMRPERQSKGQGRVGIFNSIDWVYETLGVNLLCFTAAPDNVRSVRLIDAMGMRRMGEVTSHGPGGITRQSLVWEMTAAEWQGFKAKLA